MLITTALLLPYFAPDLAPASAPRLDPTLASFVEPVAIQAQRKPVEGPRELSWKFVEVHAQLRDVDAIDDSLTGFGARGAWQFGEGIFVRGGIDLYSNDEDLTRYDIGVGQSVSIRSDASAFASVSWVWQELDGDGGSDFDENGWRFEGGFRAVFDERLGGEVRIGYEDVVDDGFIYGAELRYWFLPQVAVGGGYEHEVDDDIWTLGLRYAF